MAGAAQAFQPAAVGADQGVWVAPEPLDLRASGFRVRGRVRGTQYATDRGISFMPFHPETYQSAPGQFAHKLVIHLDAGLA
jgi:hypothetical protein